jgi:hypothetical protein
VVNPGGWSLTLITRHLGKAPAIPAGVVPNGTIAVMLEHAARFTAITALLGVVSCGDEVRKRDASPMADAASDRPGDRPDASDASGTASGPTEDAALDKSGVFDAGSGPVDTTADAAASPPDVASTPPTVACPGTPPSAGTVCLQSNDCFYEDCARYGQTQASCAGGVWDVTTASCAGNPCHSDSGNFDRNCVAGQICVRRKGAIVMPECYDNPCAGQASELQSCLQAKYAGCYVVTWLGTGATVDCDSGSCSSTTCQ